MGITRKQSSFYFLKKLGSLILILLVISGIIFISKISGIQIEDLLQKQEKQEEKEEFPELKNPKEISFNWEFDSKEYKLTTTLYKTVYDFYGRQPKKYTCIGSCSPGWEEKYYKRFLEVPEEDSTFKELAAAIEQEAQNYGFNDDQALEVAVSFVQSIPYDKEKAIETSLLARYPYEVLYDKKGVCSGKSFLGALLVKELGYGIALFSYEKEEHMAIGIKCPQQVSSYNSGYCFTELTNPGWRIGIEDFDDIQGIRPSERTPVLKGVPEIYKVAEGKTYEGVYESLEKKEEIKVLEREIDQREKEINELKGKLDYYRRVEDYNSYNDLVPTYNNLVNIQRTQIEKYNSLIKEFTPGR